MLEGSALTDIAYKLLAFSILTPIVGCLFRILVSLSGRTVIADEDIVQFLLEPAGWVCLVVIGALSIAIIALEQAALMAVVCAANFNRHLGVSRALVFAGASAWPVLRVTTRIIGLTIFAATPFLAVAGLTYVTLLTRFDINFYLTQQPIEFKIALGIAGLLGIGLAVLLLRLATSWFYALPLVMFEDVPPKRALRVSRDRVRGHRTRVVAWIIAWLLVTFLLSALATWMVTSLARLLVPRFMGSLGLLLLAVGITLLAWVGVNLVTNLLSTTSFAVVFFRLYADLACPQGVDGSRLDAWETRTQRATLRPVKTPIRTGRDGYLRVGDCRRYSCHPQRSHRGRCGNHRAPRCFRRRSGKHHGFDPASCRRRSRLDGDRCARDS